MSTVKADALANELGTARIATASVAHGAASAWVHWQVTGTINRAFNVSSVTDNAVGDYTVNFTTAMPTAYYAAMGFSYNPNYGTGLNLFQIQGNQNHPPTTTSCGMFSKYDDGGTQDVEMNMMVFFARGE